MKTLELPTQKMNPARARFICNRMGSANLRMRHLKHAHIHLMSLVGK